MEGHRDPVRRTAAATAFSRRAPTAPCRRISIPISYYGEQDLPILGALAEGYTTFDNYFCSMMGPTWENRLYQFTGTTQVGMDESSTTFPATMPSGPAPFETTIFDRVRAGRLDGPPTTIMESR